MPLDSDLERLLLQEDRLQFTQFNATIAWEFGTRLRTAAEARVAPVAIDIHVNGSPLFFTALAGATPDNLDWIRRKRNVVLRFQRSSYAIGMLLQKQHTTLEASRGVDRRDYATHGGSFPIVLQGTGCIGAITVSGLPQREDHMLIVEVLAAFLGQPLQEFALSNDEEPLF